MLRDAISAAFLFVFASLVFFASMEYQEGAAVFPGIVSMIMMIASSVLFIRSIRAIRLKQIAGGDSMAEDALFPRGEVLLVLLSAVYVGMVPVVGFIIGSLVFIPISSYLLGLRNWVVMLGTTALFTAATTFLFARIFGTPLPRGFILSLF